MIFNEFKAASEPLNTTEPESTLKVSVSVPESASMISPAPDCEAKLRVAPTPSAIKLVPLKDAVAKAGPPPPEPVAEVTYPTSL